ncbi:MAG: V-type ATP synthase subunit A [Erysipelotrichaceae bacterium]|jgi:V/A-type H+-transporting ATPase subunit A|uniref:V-type ATP synthase subunit A n=1 Tax=Lactimicrobium massiliense TaxID=2161814 RepID=UPI000D553A4A|nr:V-type ATP synthase subunit A [Lactimicrobium massiliense]MCH4020462.1 V-type ATP synthase subunit A [Erysipelotrichaceae bacterium]MCI1326529.1 V-type ATP synthase subunit A [Solobacterium sp.]MCH4044543.1 V-type ATP synthase subunit A [Erysipelotrichaceae bacterium]MCH4121755.1 V-type ATP synthase subunit A [Erysipelotrichaceae bacterium]MCI1363227.1 V-type ATP synthase subunit A [Solobacterium sp.]
MSDVIYSINGSVISVRNSLTLAMSEMVYVGEKKLLGEVIRIDDDRVMIQVYESTTGLKPGEEVVGTGNLLNAVLGPGILRNIYDGIERPLQQIADEQGAFISEGRSIPSLDADKKWDVTMKIKVGDKVKEGEIFATCPETSLIEHRSMIPIGVNGTVVKAVENGSYTVNDVLAVVQNDNTGRQTEVTLHQQWPIRKPRPILKREPISMPLVTGQRVVDTMFPIAKGGSSALPGGFGAGKTMMQHQIAKWCDADIIIYVGCGERGNEMTQALEEFSELTDPKSGKPLLDRTVLIANTSNMPVAAREASIYTGVTIAEYYRDMGYHVALMADSTSRWAEALREISGRLEEMPAEEGFPAYLPSRIAQFYERAGYVDTLSGSKGSVTLIGAVSPQGGDFSEPVTANTKRFVRCFWALDKSLAYARHFPAMNWTDSYSEYVDDLSHWYNQNVAHDFLDLRAEMQEILHEESNLMEVVKLIGSDVLPEDQKLTLEIARVIRVGFLQQNAFHKDDTSVSLQKQYKMLKTIDYLKRACSQYVAKKIPVSLMVETGIFEKVIQIKYEVPNDKIEMLDEYPAKIDAALASIA